MRYICLLASALFGVLSALSQEVKVLTESFEPVQVSLSITNVEGKASLRVTKDSRVKEFDEPTFAKLRGLQFSNGVIEVKVLSRLLKDAPDIARGFIGVAFRIDEKNSSYDSIYIRPTNGRADDQVRRNHSIQYYAYPNHKFDRLRKEAPEKYESYADMGLNEWITMRLEVNGNKATLYLNDNRHPSLIVNDLKGSEKTGGIGLWVDVGTEGFFSDIKVTPLPDAQP